MDERAERGAASRGPIEYLWRDIKVYYDRIHSAHNIVINEETRPKNQPLSVACVHNRVASVPQSLSGRRVRIRPLRLQSPRGYPRRTGAS